jgi:hypothetical protein
VFKSFVSFKGKAGFAIIIALIHLAIKVSILVILYISANLTNSIVVIIASFNINLLNIT